MPSPLASRPIDELRQRFLDHLLDPEEVVGDALGRARSAAHLGAFVHLDEPGALGAARDSARRLREGRPRPLEGIPVAIKDVFPVAGWPLRMGSRTSSTSPQADDGVVARRLRGAGAVLIGATHSAEFGQSATTEHLLGPPAVLPWDPTRTAGGSSGGSAVAVAVGAASIGIGADGGGSVRIPASFTGLVGLKPTHAEWPDDGGLRAMSPFQDPGLMAWRVADARAGFAVLFAEDPSSDDAQLAIGVDEVPNGAAVDPRLVQAVGKVADMARDAGHHVTPHPIDTTGWLEVFGPLVVAEEHQRRAHLLHDPEPLTDYARAAIEAGASAGPDDLARAHAAHDAYRSRVIAALRVVDVLLTPVVATLPFPVGHRPRTVAGRRVGATWGPFPFTAQWNVAGVPALTLPVDVVDGLPVGVQLIAPPGQERRLLTLAAALEHRLGLDLSSVMTSLPIRPAKD